MNAWIELLKVIPTLIVGLIATRIAWQQAQTAKEQKSLSDAKFKFELFEKRLEFYESVCHLVESAKNYRSLEDARESLQKIIELERRASFLFGADVQDLVEQVCLKVADLGQGVKATIENNSAIPSETLAAIKSANKWLENAPIHETFRPYLDLSNWR